MSTQQNDFCQIRLLISYNFNFVHFESLKIIVKLSETAIFTLNEELVNFKKSGHKVPSGHKVITLCPRA